MTTAGAEIDPRLAKALGEQADRLDLEMIDRAYRFSADAHRGQKRLSGHAFISHSVAVARIRGGAQQVVVLAVDILSQGSHQNFESLRVLSESLDFPWQPESNGFIPGEAAVALASP